MRLHRLRLRAVGPFAGEEHVDFERLATGGLFLLDGPTGAGKSTVLDAITFALYGPGERGGDGRLHSQFADPDVVPEVELEFSLRGVRQRITRSPEFVRPKRRGGGTTTQAAAVHLERFESGSWVSRSSNKAEVAEMLADDLGLSRDQFTQVVLLPQGEFMKFLRADDDDRRVLLTRLFGTQLYDRITEELDRRRKIADVDLATSERAVRSRVAAAAEAAGLDLTQQDELLAVEPAELNSRCDLLAADLAERATAAKAGAAEAGVQLAESKAVVAAASSAADRLKRFAQAVEAHRVHEQSRAEFEQAMRVVAAAERAEPVRPLLAVLDDANAAFAAAIAAVESTAATVASTGVELEEAWLEGLDHRAVAAVAADHLRLAVELAPLVEREAEAARLTAEVECAAEQLRTVSSSLAELSERRAALPDLRNSVERRLEVARIEGAQVGPATSRREALGRQREAVAALADLEPRRVSVLAAREQAIARYELASTRYFSLVEARLNNMAAELAAGLGDGEECPVCGATEHPGLDSSTLPIVAHDLVTGPDEINTADSARRRAEADRDHVSSEWAELEQLRAALTERAAAASVAELDHELAALDGVLRGAAAAVELVPELEAERAALDADASDLATRQAEAAAEQATAVAVLAASEARVADLIGDLDKARDGHRSVSERVDALTMAAEQLALLRDSLAMADATKAQLASARSRAEVEAATSGFPTLPDARAAVVVPADLDGLREARSEWQAQASRLAGALAVAEFDGLDAVEAAEQSEAAWTASIQAAAVADQAEAAAAQAALAADRATGAANRFAKRRREVTAAQAAHLELSREAAPVVHLARLARGVTGNRRVALTTYVLRQWFEQVVVAANLRLNGMSSGRYELVRVDEGSTKIERTGLTLQVLDHHTGEQRSPRSLSGGETFYTSLALALGLADVVRAEAGGVELDTLFIDEGFGSLDADTLDQVMEVIDELRGRGRSVGIVSHVSELKDRIAERVEVRRTSDGSSTLSVVA